MGIGGRAPPVLIHRASQPLDFLHRKFRQGACSAGSSFGAVADFPNASRLGGIADATVFKGPRSRVRTAAQAVSPSPAAPLPRRHARARPKRDQGRLPQGFTGIIVP